MERSGMTRTGRDAYPAMLRPESIRPCCGTPTDRTAPSPHAADCRYAPGGPTAYSRTVDGAYCIALRCPIIPLHRASAPGCILES